MIVAGLVAFNLLVNGVASFALAWLVACGAARLFRAAPGRAHVALFALPFVKLAFDATRGVPAGSFLWLRARGVPQDLGAFQLGVGLDWGVPHLQLALGALAGGHLYSQSAADLAADALRRRVHVFAPAIVAGALLVVAAFRLARRCAAARTAARARRALEATAGLRGFRRVGWRRVAILVAEAAAGSPFTGGILRPYVVFPHATWAAMTPAERRAALAHELAHVAEHHVLVLSLTGVVRDLFWFLPFIGRAERRLRAACELAADARAIRRAPPAVLASALVRAGEALSLGRDRLAPTLGADGAGLAARVALLLDAPPPPRFGFAHAWGRPLLTAWVGATVLVSLVFGNH